MLNKYTNQKKRIIRRKVNKLNIKTSGLTVYLSTAHWRMVWRSSCKFATKSPRRWLF